MVVGKDVQEITQLLIGHRIYVSGVAFYFLLSFAATVVQIISGNPQFHSLEPWFTVLKHRYHTVL